MLEYLNHFKIIESLIIIVVGSIIRIMITNSLKKIRVKFGFQKTRVLIVNRIITFLVYAAVIVLIAFIWGVDEKQLMVYVSSFLTILGIAFFAQWSILSNITAGLILYINYPVKIGDTITILEKDNNITGIINDIGAFFYNVNCRKWRFNYLTKHRNFTEKHSV